MICEDENWIDLANCRVRCWADALLVTKVVVLVSLGCGFPVSSLVYRIWIQMRERMMFNLNILRSFPLSPAAWIHIFSTHFCQLHAYQIQHQSVSHDSPPRPLHKHMAPFKMLAQKCNCSTACWTEIGNVMWKRVTGIVSCILQYLNPLCGRGPTCLIQYADIGDHTCSGKVYFTLWLQFF